MSFRSILFPKGRESMQETRTPSPDSFRDLHLDRIVAAITAGKAEYDLGPFFRLPLRDPDDIAFRHEVMRDLEQPGVLASVRTFAAAMRTVREHLARADRLRHRLQKQRWRLDATVLFCAAVARLSEDLSRAPIGSRGLSDFRDHLTRLVASADFIALRDRATGLAERVAAIRYTVLVRGAQVQVGRYRGEPDYGADVARTFAKFRQGSIRDYRFEFPECEELNHVEAMILEQVARLHEEIFSELELFLSENEDFVDPAVRLFDREIQFYVAYLEYLEPFRNAGLPFCYPEVSRTSKEVSSDRGFDLALAGRLIRENAVPVCNDFHLAGRERILVVSGPNQGGKTTFARTFGQLHHLASLGCPVPGRRARLFLFDRIFTHFEREERSINLRGKLEDDLVRIREILDQATSDSIVILNEIFTSTTFRDAQLLSRKIATRLMELDLLCVWVTFLDELASLDERTVSMVSTVAPGNPARRTFRIVRRAADGLAYALSIAEKHRLTYRQIRERLGG